MKVGAIVGGLLLVVLLVGAAAFYMLSMPGRLANGYKDDAEPQQEKLRAAMKPVYRTLDAETFGVDRRPLDRAKNPDQYVRAIDRATSKALRELQPADTAITRAKRTFERADEDALFETPSWPLLDGRGDLEDAEELAGGERSYVREARAFLKHYDRLVSFMLDLTHISRDFGVAFGRGFGAIPANPGSPGQVTRPLDRTATKLDAELRSLRKLKAPPELRKNHKAQVGAARFIVTQIRELSSAVKARNLGRIEAFDRNFARGLARYEAPTTLRRLLTRSSYAKNARKLRDRERSLARAYKRL